MTSKQQKFRAALDALTEPPPLAPSPAPTAAAPKPAKPDTVPVNLRMPAELRAYFVQHAAKIQAESGKPTTAQQVMLMALDRFSRGYD